MGLKLRRNVKSITELTVSKKGIFQKYNELIAIFLELINHENDGYIARYFDEISINKFGYTCEEYLYLFDIKPLSNFKIHPMSTELFYIMDGVEFHQLTIEDIFKKIKCNENKTLNFLEFFKNLFEDIDEVKKTKYISFSQNGNVVRLQVQKFLDDLNLVVSYLDLSWSKRKGSDNLEKWIIEDSNLKNILDSISVKSSGIAKTEWKNVISEFYKSFKNNNYDVNAKIKEYTAMLRLISPVAEEFRKKIELEDKTISTKLFLYLNKLEIRHSNSEQKIYKEFNISSEDEYCNLLKKCLQLFLTAMIVIDKST